MAEPRPLLEARGITRGYGRIQVLQDVDITIGERQAHVVIGPNGAGKSTLFKSLSGEIFPTAGTVRFDGADVTRVPAWKRTRLGFGRTFQVARVFTQMTVRENMLVAVESAGRGGGGWALATPRAREAELDELLADVGLAAQRDAQAGSLAYGDRKRLELGMTLALSPKLLLLDEPTAGMSQADRHASVELVARVTKERGIALLLTEHDMDVVFGLATQLTVLHYGRVIASGDPQAVRADPKVREVYLGHE
ncbi:MAG TPA: ABC transporter ATP-binding protein [Quisquiliibacterium sp.]|nr:ABC transporter ATP-binding protein [Quisquiliibacterium sp.]